MKSYTAFGILAVAVYHAVLATAARESVTVEENGISFEFDIYDDGRSKPYRVTFTNPDDDVTSTFRWVRCRRFGLRTRGVSCATQRAINV